MGHATTIMLTVIIHHYNKYSWETVLPYKKNPQLCHNKCYCIYPHYIYPQMLLYISTYPLKLDLIEKTVIIYYPKSMLLCISVDFHISFSHIFICFESFISCSGTAFKDSLLVIINAFGTIWQFSTSYLTSFSRTINVLVFFFFKCRARWGNKESTLSLKTTFRFCRQNSYFVFA